MQARAKLAKIVRALRERLIAESGEPAAFIWLNRLVTLRLLEGMTSRPAPRLTGGEGDGWAFDELAVDMPGLFGAESSPIAWPTLRDAIADLDDPELASCWSDDMTLGWVYQYWNDPDRERLDVELAAGGKLAASEIASKTQMFTERYGVDWLVQNGLGRTWMAICAKQGWTAKVVADGTLARLDARRADWRAQRVAGAVEPTELMPLHSDEERRWAYYVEQPMPADAPELAPESVRAIKLIDPAVGSGHFLVVALEFLVGLHREEAEQRGELGQPQWSDQAIVESILANNLYGIDLDPRAVQIAAAALLLVAQRISPQARPRRINLVASRVAVAGLSNAGLALADLGISAQAAQGLVRQLAEADHLGRDGRGARPRPSLTSPAPKARQVH